MAELDVLRCGNCNAPVSSGDTHCRYCRYELVQPASAPAASATPAPARAPSRAERLGAAIAPSLARVWSEGAAAWRAGKEDDAALITRILR